LFLLGFDDKKIQGEYQNKDWHGISSKRNEHKLPVNC